MVILRCWHLRGMFLLAIGALVGLSCSSGVSDAQSEPAGLAACERAPDEVVDLSEAEGVCSIGGRTVIVFDVDRGQRGSAESIGVPCHGAAELFVFTLPDKRLITSSIEAANQIEVVINTAPSLVVCSSLPARTAPTVAPTAPSGPVPAYDDPAADYVSAASNLWAAAEGVLNSDGDCPSYSMLDDLSAERSALRQQTGSFEPEVVVILNLIDGAASDLVRLCETSNADLLLAGFDRFDRRLVELRDWFPAPCLTFPDGTSMCP